MTAPTTSAPGVTGPAVRFNTSPGSKASPFGAPAAPNNRTTALQSAVAIMRGRQPAAKAEDVLAMAEEFYQFLKKG